ncbi:helix-turn-helix domain-containing protein [Archangium lansingense]|uniref:Helix-turn-helix transcriptional regulator n=1 Tax=Archangium lansingense TaxID=2995310 RepID=A0ABT4APZ6_9BACT|nr:helix-turn-helix transcriptional regulator [Archangium lansinium]MCY1083783.1 helix-turn-helix transcriptional regulator [Archangium lansinium]
MNRRVPAVNLKRLAPRIGAACRAARQKLQLTQEDVAERVGLATEVYGRLERGNMTPSVPTLRKLCLSLNLSADVALALDDTAELPPRPMLEEEQSADVRRLLRRARELPPDRLKILLQLANVFAKDAGARTEQPRAAEDAA